MRICDISIIIPTKNRSNILKKCLVKLSEQITDAKFEILVVDNGSSNVEKYKINKIVKLHDNVVLLESNKVGPAIARNFAIKRSRGSVLLYINDDTIVKSDFVQNHWKFHMINRGVYQCLVGRFIEHPKLIDNNIMRWLTKDSKMHFCYDKKYGIVSWGYFWTCNLPLKKSFVTKNNLYFNENFKVAAWEDVELGYRAHKAGMQLYMSQEIDTYHWHKFNIEDLQKRFYSHGRGLYILSKHIPHNLLPPLARIYIQIFFKFMLFFLGYRIWRKILINFFNRNNIINNLFQLEIVYQKIKGFEYEKKTYNANLSRN